MDTSETIKWDVVERMRGRCPLSVTYFAAKSVPEHEPLGADSLAILGP
jgi:hypothetical protein